MARVARNITNDVFCLVQWIISIQLYTSVDDLLLLAASIGTHLVMVNILSARTFHIRYRYCKSLIDGATSIYF